MDTIFFDLRYNSIADTLIKVAVFTIASILLLWLIYFTLTKLLYRKSRHRKEINLRIVFLWSLFAYFILFNIYLFVLFYIIDPASLDSSSSQFYIGSIPQLTIYVFLIIFFIIKRATLKKIINGHSIN